MSDWVDRAVARARCALDLFAADRRRKVVSVCLDCSFEICDNDIAPHVCPPRPPASNSEPSR